MADYKNLFEAQRQMSCELSIYRLDSLPDEVICHILSFLPTRLSMSTSVLAKRWRFLWAHVPVWDFEGNFKKGLETPNLDVIYSVIQRHKVKTIHSLRLSIGCYESQLNTLISTTMERNIRNLHIDLGVNTIVFLHRTLFTCKTVVEMRLDNGLCLPSTGGACLPSLKKLHLSKVDYEDDNALTYLLSGCPLLQELIIDHSADETDMRFFHVVSSTIKMLEVNCQIDSGYPVQILTIVPELRSLRVVDCDFAIPIYMASLVELDIHFKCLDFGFGNNDNSNAVPFFNRLSNISCLKLSSCEYLKVIDRFGLFGGSSIKFNNLTKLELQLGVEWHLLVEFLEVADNLEVLVADVKIHNSCMEPKQVPKCLLSSLKTITIKQQGFEEHELDLVRYLLRNSQVLERMEILPRKVRSTSSSSGFLKNDLTAAFKAFERISLFEPGSKACQLAFFSDCGVIEIVE